jgi:sugar phosphate isomerase/epimerase
VRLVEACGPEAFGIVYDTNNGLQRLEHPVWVAKRVAPYTRQTHFKDSGAIFVGRNVGMAWRPCGKGVVDFAAILTILAAAQPELNITIENSEPFENGPKLVKFNQLELAEPAFIEAHPDVTVEEYADFVDMVHSYEKRLASGEVPVMEESVRDFDYAAAVNDILYSRDHLRGICETLNLPLRKLVA